VAEKEMLPMQPGRRRSHLRRHHGSGTGHIGFRPATNIEDGIAHFAKWYREFHKGQSPMSRRIIPLIMCGGAGTRLWPASREVRPSLRFNEAAGESVEPFRNRIHSREALPIKMALEAWAASQPQTLEKWPDLPNAIQERDADVWEALIAVCDMAGGSWPSRIRYAVVTLVTAAKEAEPIVSLSMRDHARFRSRKTGKPFDFIHLTGFARDPVRWHLARERRRWRGRESRPLTRQP
jgi:Protein of unknown function (DUF3631)